MKTNQICKSKLLYHFKINLKAPNFINLSYNTIKMLKDIKSNVKPVETDKKLDKIENVDIIDFNTNNRCISPNNEFMEKLRTEYRYFYGDLETTESFKPLGGLIDGVIEELNIAINDRREK